MGSCASTGAPAPEPKDAPVERPPRKGPVKRPPKAADSYPTDQPNESKRGDVEGVKPSAASESPVEEELTNQPDPLMSFALKGPRPSPARRQQELVSFNEANLLQLDLHAIGHDDARRAYDAAASPSGILQKSTSLSGNTGEKSGPCGPEQWRQRRLARANGEEGSMRSSRGSSISLQTPTPRFLNIEGTDAVNTVGEKTPQEEEAEFLRVQNLVSRMNQPKLKTPQFSETTRYSNDYSAIGVNRIEA